MTPMETSEQYTTEAEGSVDDLAHYYAEGADSDEPVDVIFVALAATRAVTKALLAIAAAIKEKP